MELSYVPAILTTAYWTPHKGPEIAEKLSSTILISCTLYIPLILLGQKIMKNYAPFDLKKFLILWNFALAILSLLGTITILMSDHKVLSYIFYDEANYKPGTRAVIALFTITKAIEFGDTIFLVLKKKPIVFLHLYHHLTVTIYCWHAQLINIYFGHYFVFINLCIHTIMYFYYGMSILLPRNWILRFCRPYITLSQTLQMFVGVVLSYIAVSSNFPAVHIFNAQCSLLMYVSYALLFSRFYITNYSKTFRPDLTLLIVSIHILAIAGFFLMLKHNNFTHLLAELLIGYITTIFILYLTMIPHKSIHKQQSFYSNSWEKFGYFFSSIMRMVLLLLNCLAVWIKDYAYFSLISKTNSFTACTESSPQSLVKSEEETIYDQAMGKKTGITSPVSESTNASSSPLQSPSTSSAERLSPEPIAAKKQQSILLSYMNKTHQKSSTNNSSTNDSSGKSANSQTTHLYNQYPPAHPIGLTDAWLLILCFIAPAIYSINKYGEFFLGLCVHGSLRWVLELHTANYFLGLLYKTPKKAKSA